jgi:hypothetical protein
MKKIFQLFLIIFLSFSIPSCERNDKMRFVEAVLKNPNKYEEILNNFNFSLEYYKTKMKERIKLDKESIQLFLSKYNIDSLTYEYSYKGGYETQFNGKMCEISRIFINNKTTRKCYLHFNWYKYKDTLYYAGVAIQCDEKDIIE